MENKYNASKVIIDGKEYTVARLLNSGSRGYEYLLSDDKNANCRVCAAYPKGYKVRASGEELEFK